MRAPYHRASNVTRSTSASVHCRSAFRADRRRLRTDRANRQQSWRQDTTSYDARSAHTTIPGRGWVARMRLRTPRAPHRDSGHAPESIEPTMRKMDQLTLQCKSKRHSDLISPRVSSARQQRQVAVEVRRCCLHPPPWHRARGRAAGTCQINRWEVCGVWSLFVRQKNTHCPGLGVKL